jgi:DNA polymerase-3 subunit alpha
MEWADVQDANASQCSLFDADEGGAAPPALLSVPPWNDRQKLSEEKTALGFYLTGHLFDADAPKVRPFIKTQLAKLAPSRDLVWMTGVCAALRTQITKRGKMAFLTLDDASGAVEISVFNELFEQSRSWLKEDVLVVVQGKVSDDAYSGGLRVVADRICTLAEARAEFVHGLRLAINGRADAAKLDALLKPHVAADKSCLVEIDYQNDAASCTLRLSDQWRVRPDDALMEKLQAWLGEGRVSWIY